MNFRVNIDLNIRVNTGGNGEDPDQSSKDHCFSIECKDL